MPTAPNQPPAWPNHSRKHSTVIQGQLEALFAELSDCRDGAVADYIPELAKANPEAFGLVLATVDGRIYAVGDVDCPFTIQSISKPFMYALALQRLSPAFMQAKVGVEPSGDAFNAISLDPATGIPRNPMINAGAIATAAQVWQHDPDQAEALTLAFFSDLAGRRLEVDEAVYRCERETGHRNRAISHLLRNAAVIEQQPDAGLDLYFRQCSIALTCRDLAVMAATLACQGRNPLTQAQPLDPATTTRVLAVMGSCGMYDFAGQWLYDVGMPAKSGVAGGVMAVVPGRLGIAVYSPRLDAYGNSVRGVATCRRLSQVFDLHLFDRSPLHQSPVRSSYRGTERRSRCWRCAAETLRLEPLLQQLAVIQAQGVLDFAALEVLLSAVEAAAADARVIVLDLGQVSELPRACAALLAAQEARLVDSGVVLLCCRAAHLEWPAGTGAGLQPLASLDLALEAAEDQLLAQSPPAAPGQGVPDETGFLAALPQPQRQLIAARLELRSYEAGTVVMAPGEASDHLFIAASGRFTIHLPTAHSRGESGLSRVATFAAGMAFGDGGFLSGRPRQAEVMAETDGQCWLLHRRDLDQLERENPAVALALLRALAHDLADRLTFCCQQLTLVELL
jgi:glutaminase